MSKPAGNSWNIDNIHNLLLPLCFVVSFVLCLSASQLLLLYSAQKVSATPFACVLGGNTGHSLSGSAYKCVPRARACDMWSCAGPLHTFVCDTKSRFPWSSGLKPHRTVPVTAPGSMELIRPLGLTLRQQLLLLILQGSSTHKDKEG